MDWKDKAIELASSGMSWRKVAKKLNKPKSTVSDALRKHFKGYVKPSDNKAAGKPVNALKTHALPYDGKPRVLFIDIETNRMLLGGWSVGTNFFGIDQIEEDWTILSYGYKWLEDNDVTYLDIVDFGSEEDILHHLHGVLSEADFVVGHNIRRFDLKKIKSRMLVHGMKPFGKPRTIDTYEIARREFGFSSNKLSYLTKLLCKKYIKSSHDKFHGYSLWKEFAAGNREAIEEMRDYCRLDVLSLQELLEILAPWDNKLPNFDAFYDTPSDNDEWEEVGFYYTNLGKYKKLRHKVTGQYRRGSKNLLTKEKRESLLRNIV